MVNATKAAASMPARNCQRRRKWHWQELGRMETMIVVHLIRERTSTRSKSHVGHS